MLIFILNISFYKFTRKQAITHCQCIINSLEHGIHKNFCSAQGKWCDIFSQLMWRTDIPQTHLKNDQLLLTEQYTKMTLEMYYRWLSQCILTLFKLAPQAGEHLLYFAK